MPSVRSGFAAIPSCEGIPNPLALTALDVNASIGRVDSERGEEAVTVGAGVLDPGELGVDLGRVALVAVGPPTHL